MRPVAAPSPPTGSGRAGRTPARGPAGTHTVTYPHLRPGRTAELALHAPNAALLIDFDNVTLGIQSDLTKELRTLLNSDIIKGKVAVQRAYADWRRYPQYIVPLSESSIDLIFAPAFGSNKKNATDIRLAIDAIELVFTRPEIGTFIIMSGDSDFSTMVIKLKEYGKYVIGVGIRESASDLLIQNCDEYFSYNDLAGLTKETEPGTSTRDPWELAQEAVSQMARNGDVMRSDRLKQVMQQIDPQLRREERRLQPLQQVRARGRRRRGSCRSPSWITASLKWGRLGRPRGLGRALGQPRRRATGRRVEGGDGGAGEGAGGGRRPSGRPLVQLAGAAGTAGAADTGAAGAAAPAAPKGPTVLSLARAFQLMSDALAEFRGPVAQGPLRLRMVAMHGREDPLLDEARFSRLLRQANDAEVADVRQVGDDDFEVTPRRRAEGRAAGPAHRAAPAGSAPSASAAAAATNGGAASGNAATSSAPETSAPSRATAAAAPAAPAGESRDNGPRRGVRFRRGSRGPSRMSDVPLVGVVRQEVPAEAAPAAAPVAEPAQAPAKPEKAKAAKRPRAKAAKAAKPADAAKAADTAKPARRPARPRTAKKAE